MLDLVQMNKGVLFQDMKARNSLVCSDYEEELGSSKVVSRITTMTWGRENRRGFGREV